MIPTTKLTIEYANGDRSEVVVKPRTQVAFERKFNTAIAVAFDPESPNGMRFEYMYFMAWHASRASQEFDVWLDLVEGIDVEVDESEGPTPPAPSDGQ